MADLRPENTPPRSRSSTAFSLLSRRHREFNPEEEPVSDDSGRAGSVSSRTSSHHLPSSHPRDRSTSSAHTYSHGPSLSTSAAQASLASSKQSPAVPAPLAAPAAPAVSRAAHSDKGISIEQSVRKFRIVEALRTGDIKAISKVIYENQSHGAAGLAAASSGLDDTTILHLAIQCAQLPVVEFFLSNWAACSADDTSTCLDVNARDKDGNTPLHLAAVYGRAPIVRLLLDRADINDSIANNHGKLPIDLTRSPEIFQQMQLARSLFSDGKIRQVQQLVAKGDYDTLKDVLDEPRLKSLMDVNCAEFASEPATVETGGTLLHEAARRKNSALIQLLLFHGADPFRRDRRGKLPQDVTKDEPTRAMLKKSPAAVAAQRGIQEKAVLGHAAAQGAAATAGFLDAVGGKESREMKGYLKKWTNYRRGFQLRWFVLENGVLSYYKHQDDADSVCRGVINMRIAQLHMSADDKTKFDIIGNASVKYSLRANHEVEAKRWIWTLNNAIQWTKDQARDEERQRARSAEVLRQAKAGQLSTAGRGGDSASVRSATSAAAAGHGPAGVVMDGHSERRVSVSNAGKGEDQGSSQKSQKSQKSQRSQRSQVADVTELRQQPLPSQHLHRDGLSSTVMAGDGDAVLFYHEEDDYDDDEQGHDLQGDDDDPTGAAAAAASKDALNITAQSVRLQLELMGNVGTALGGELARNPTLPMSDARIAQALSTYDAATRSLRTLVGDLIKIARDRDDYWQRRLGREVEMRRMWEESMARVALEHEELQARVSETEMQRKLTRRALREVIETGAPASAASKEVVGAVSGGDDGDGDGKSPTATITGRQGGNVVRGPTSMVDLADADSNEENEEFFDAVEAGQVQVLEMPPTATRALFPLGAGAGPGCLDAAAATASDYAAAAAVDGSSQGARVVAIKQGVGRDISSAFKGYENGVRTKLKLETDDRPKISLWGILKSMIGKDITRMTLPVTFNEPTSLLHRCAEDMEYAELLDLAAGRVDSLERLMYVAAFAASEYVSTIGRVAKPFNPLLGETFEYARPDKGYRFLIEQVSHHPPVGAAWAESARWTYYGESSVRSRFSGKSFDVNPLGTWFLRLRPSQSSQSSQPRAKESMVAGGGGRGAEAGSEAGSEAEAGATNGDGEAEELYTWKKVTTSVVGIISGKPMVDNYGPMEIRNWTTGEVCTLNFKARGWTASSAYQLTGRVLDAQGRARYSIGGRWDSRIYARLLAAGGSEDSASMGDDGDMSAAAAGLGAGPVQGPGLGPDGAEKAILLWQAHERPSGTPFNLTPFVVTFNQLDEQLRPWLAPTDSRLRPDQRAMEEGQYEVAATEKSRLEEGQRARRRAREARGTDFAPAWFGRDKCAVTGETYWRSNGRYWDVRARQDWGNAGLEAIYDDADAAREEEDLGGR